jgi:hypothetical protein
VARPTTRPRCRARARSIRSCPDRSRRRRPWRAS